jgi:hypothetical protein
MDIYQQIIGDCMNPMLAWLAEKWGMSIEDLAQISAFGAGAELWRPKRPKKYLLVLTWEIQDILAGLDVEDNLRGTLRSLLRCKKTEEGNLQAMDPTKASNEKKDVKGDEEKKSQNVHEVLIDLEKVRQSALNSTAAMGDL